LLASWLLLSEGWDRPASADADPPSDRATPIIGTEKSRYPEQSPFWEVAERATAAGRSAAPGFRFAWGDARWHAEGAVAMAASVALQQFVGLADTHRRFCPGQAACNMIDFESRPTEPRFVVRRLMPGPTDPGRANALTRCNREFPRFRDQLRQTLQSSRGVVLAVYQPNAFALKGSRVGNDSIHIFAMYGVDANGGILLRDSADRVPVTYRLRAGRECEALTVPRAFDVDRARDRYENWALSAWVVEASRPISSPSPVPPAPNPLPRPGPPSADDLPGVLGQDPFDLGEFRLPADAFISARFLFETAGGAPARLQLKTGITRAITDESRQSLVRIERQWSVARVGDAFTFRSTGAPGNPLSDAYRSLGRSDKKRLAALASRFDAAARRLGKDRRWLATSVIRFVQNIPYDLVEEDPIGIRTPVEVLGKGGDCDSKSLLAAVLLQILGFRTIVLTNDSLSHAVLGVDLPATGTYFVADGTRYALVECTTPWAVGDLSGSGTQGDARSSGWKAHLVQL
jgi:hypothetical protein